MKARRHAAILRLVRDRRIHSQEEFRDLLRAEGISVTQATLSRDIHELGLVKAADPHGTAFYALPAPTPVVQPALAQLVRTLLVSLDGVGNLLVLRTPAGSANALASALDRERWREIVGTVAGDDTILLITRSAQARRRLADRLRELGRLPEA
jgi:transcriptional regulator of arginine metabolism